MNVRPDAIPGSTNNPAVAGTLPGVSLNVVVGGTIPGLHGQRVPDRRVMREGGSVEDRSPGGTWTAWRSGRIRRTRRTANFQNCILPVTLAAVAGDLDAAKLRNRLDRRFVGDVYRQSAAGEVSDEAIAVWIDGGIGDTVTGPIRHGFPKDSCSQFPEHMPFEAGDRQSLPFATPGLVRSGFSNDRSGVRKPDLRRPMRIDQDG